MSTNDFDTSHLSGNAKRVADSIVAWLTGANATAPSGGGCRAFYTPEEWRERGEKHGTEAALILCHDGGDLAPYCNLDYDIGCGKLHDLFQSMLEKQGYYVEACTSWYSAVYPVAHVKPGPFEKSGKLRDYVETEIDVDNIPMVHVYLGKCADHDGVNSAFGETVARIVVHAPDGIRTEVVALSVHERRSVHVVEMNVIHKSADVTHRAVLRPWDRRPNALRRAADGS